ncbi:hypothetical protein [Pectobacterium cacticida]|uniref:hypothetical protein n=1 Tax=Pectobacterium cacticida TaxID=69221 RepID=UPI0039866D42
MKSSITYLHLLRYTQFFTQLDTGQLRWVIQHSREWEVQPGTFLVSDVLAEERVGYCPLHGLRQCTDADPAHAENLTARDRS